MNWFIFALLSPVFWALTSIFDKFLISKVLYKTYFFPIWIASFGLPLCIFIFIFFNPMFVFPYSIIAAFEGVLWMLYYYIFAKTLSNEEVSRTMSLIFIYPIFVTILAGIFLKEVFDISKYLGIGLLVISGLLLSYKKVGKKIGIIKSLKLILMLVFLLSCIEVIDKFLVGKIGYWPLYFWTTAGLFLTVIPILFIKKIRTNFINSFKKTGKVGFLALIASEIFAISGSISYYIAIYLTHVSVVAAIGSLQPLFVLICAIFLSIFVPKFLKENLNRRNILIKSVAVLFVLIGAWLLV
jgi:drug/metabolite transporter (DMT)-like permease